MSEKMLVGSVYLPNGAVVLAAPENIEVLWTRQDGSYGSLDQCRDASLDSPTQAGLVLEGTGVVALTGKVDGQIPVYVVLDENGQVEEIVLKVKKEEPKAKPVLALTTKEPGPLRRPA